jgi:hypothetical protein
MISELLPLGGFFGQFLSCQPESASRSWYSPAENQLILFCRAVASAKKEISPGEQSGKQGFQLRGFFT